MLKLHCSWHQHTYCVKANFNIHRQPSNVVLLQVYLKESGWDIRVRNVVFHHLLTNGETPHPLTPPEHVKEQMLFIRSAQVNYNLYLHLVNKLYYQVCRDHLKY